MPFIPVNVPQVGDWVILTKPMTSLAGTFTKGTRVQITEVDANRGYEFEDEFGNSANDAGWTGFKKET